MLYKPTSDQLEAFQERLHYHFANVVHLRQALDISMFRREREDTDNTWAEKQANIKQRKIAVTLGVSLYEFFTSLFVFKDNLTDLPGQLTNNRILYNKKHSRLAIAESLGMNEVITHFKSGPLKQDVERSVMCDSLMALLFAVKKDVRDQGKSEDEAMKSVGTIVAQWMQDIKANPPKKRRRDDENQRGA